MHMYVAHGDYIEAISHFILYFIKDMWERENTRKGTR